MEQLKLGTTCEFVGTPPIVTDTTVTPNTLVTGVLDSAEVTDQSGATVLGETAANTVVLDADGLTLGMRVEGALHWTVTYDDGTEQLSTTTVHAWVLDRVYTSYGDLDDVQRNIGNVVKLGLTSQPSVVQVASLMADESYRVDSLLSAIGYATPMSTGLDFLGNIVAMYVTAHLYRTLAANRNPQIMATADMWEKRADSLLSPYLLGKAQFAGAALNLSDDTSLIPSVISQPRCAERSAFDSLDVRP